MFHIAKQLSPPIPFTLTALTDAVLETSLLAAVQALYHDIATECADDIAACLYLPSLCHTLVVMCPCISADGKTITNKAIAAVSFAVRPPTLAIMYIGVDTEFRTGGFATLLMRLARKCCVEARCKQIDRDVILRVYPDEHDKFVWYCVNRGFARHDGIPIEATTLINQTLWMKPFYRPAVDSNAADSQVGVWYMLPMLKPLARDTLLSKSYTLLKPACVGTASASQSTTMIEAACSCELGPDRMSYRQFNHCISDLKFWNHDCFTDREIAPDTMIQWQLPCGLSWIARLQWQAARKQHMSLSMMTFLLSSLIRSGSAPLWQHYVFIVPPRILQHAQRMRNVFAQYMQNVRNLDDDAVDQTELHAALAQSLFARNATVVLAYLLQHLTMLTRHAVCCVHQEADGNWTCIMTTNASHYPTAETLKKGTLVCGFVHFDPHAADAEFEVASVHPTNPVMFLLTIARTLAVTALVDPQPLTDMATFHHWYDSSSHVFGLLSDAPVWFNGNQRLVQLRLSPKYPLRCSTTAIDGAPFQSGWMCFLFVIDWCVRVRAHRFEWQFKGNVKPVQPTNDKWHFKIPQVFGIGEFVHDLGFSLVRVSSNTLNAHTGSSYMPVNERLEAMCVQSIAILCDRVMYYSGRSVSDVQQHPFYATHLQVALTTGAPSLLQIMVKDDASHFVDQSGVHEWKHQPLLPEGTVASTNDNVTSPAPSGTPPAGALKDDRSPSDTDTSDDHAVLEDSSDADDSSDNDKDDAVTAVSITSQGRLPIITAAQGSSPRKRTAIPSTSVNRKTAKPQRWKVEMEEERCKLAKQKAEANVLFKTHQSYECCSAAQCKRPGGTIKFNASDVGHHIVSCLSCNKLAHHVCVAWHNKNFRCLPCVARLKSERATRPKVPPKRKEAGLRIPRTLRKHISQQAWEVIHCKNEMNQVIARTMRKLDYPSWAALQDKVKSQNRANGVAKRSWATWTEEKRAAHRKARNDVAAERLAYVKLYNDLQKEYLRTTSSAIPDLRYDKVKKRFIGRAMWQTEANGRTLTNQQEVELSPKFVDRNFPQRVQTYVKQASLMAKGSFLPVPIPVPLTLDTRVITHCKWKPSSSEDDAARVVVKYSDRTHATMPVVEAENLFGSKYMCVIQQSSGKGFIHIPPGTANRDRYETAPVQSEQCQKLRIQFRQGNLPTCVISSFASALWAVGLSKIATQVHATVAATVDDPSILLQLGREMRERQTWLQAHKIQQVHEFDLLTADLSNTLALVILKASDGANNHAITVHDNVIFDGNECTGLPLCQDNLNYLCSTKTRHANFTGVMAGYLFREQGQSGRLLKRKQRITGDPWQCHVTQAHLR